MVYTKYSLEESGYVPGRQLVKEFSKHLNAIFRHFDLEQIRIKMSNRTRAIPLENLLLDIPTFNQFARVLEFAVFRLHISYCLAHL